MNCNENSVCNICKEPFDDGLHADCGGDCLLCMATVAQDPDCAITAVPLLMRRLAEERGAVVRLTAAMRDDEWSDEVINKIIEGVKT